MLNLSRRRPPGPGEKALAALLGLVLVAALVTVITVVGRGGGGCSGGLHRSGGECVGVTDRAFSADPRIDGLIRAIADENARVRRDWQHAAGSHGRAPYLRVALTMPFTSDATSTMSMAEIQRALAGAYAGQLAANSRSGPTYQLLLADVGKNMTHWKEVVGELAGMSHDNPPLIATMGLPSSTAESKAAVRALARARIPSVGAVITASDMNADDFFKTSPSNAQLVAALKGYLSGRPGTGDGYLITDDRQDDVYSRDLESRFLAAFDGRYGIRDDSASFVGTRGDEAGTPRLFRVPAQKICSAGVDTVFYAGRDEDLPALIGQLAQSPDCGYRKPLRILKVGIGLDPGFETARVTDELRRADITIVNASPVDPRWRQEGGTQPNGFADFDEQFRRAGKRQDMGARPLDDGYAIMYYDAFTAISSAAGESYEDVGQTRGGAGVPTESPERTRSDVANTLVNMNPDQRHSSASCTLCIDGASGTFGFDRSISPDLWPVCKAVHVIEYPGTPGGGSTAGGAKSGRGAKSGSGSREKPYSTYGQTFSGACPKGS